MRGAEKFSLGENRRVALPVGGDGGGAVEVLVHAVTDDVGRVPEEGVERGDVVRGEGAFAGIVEGGDLGDNGGVVDDEHRSGW